MRCNFSKLFAQVLSKKKESLILTKCFYIITRYFNVTPVLLLLHIMLLCFSKKKKISRGNMVSDYVPWMTKRYIYCLWHSSWKKLSMTALQEVGMWVRRDKHIISSLSHYLHPCGKDLSKTNWLEDMNGGVNQKMRKIWMQKMFTVKGVKCMKCEKYH